jgi:hypothetical protein
MTTPAIKIATASDEASAIDVVALAFSTDPAARWTWPDPQQVLTHFLPSSRHSGAKRLPTKAPTTLTATQAQRCGCHQMSTLTKTR